MSTQLPSKPLIALALLGLLWSTAGAEEEPRLPCVRARVVDESGKPIAGVRFEHRSDILDISGRDERFDRLAATSDLDGNILRLIILPPANRDKQLDIFDLGYLVLVKDGFIERSCYLPRELDSGDIHDFGQVVLERAGELLVTVRDVSNQPIEGATVVVEDAREDDPFELEPSYGKSDSAGEASFPRLRPGGYAVRVLNYEFGNASLDLVQVKAGEFRLAELVIGAKDTNPRLHLQVVYRQDPILRENSVPPLDCPQFKIKLTNGAWRFERTVGIGGSGIPDEPHSIPLPGVPMTGPYELTIANGNMPAQVFRADTLAAFPPMVELEEGATLEIRAHHAGGFIEGDDLDCEVTPIGGERITRWDVYQLETKEHTTWYDLLPVENEVALLPLRGFQCPKPRKVKLEAGQRAVVQFELEPWKPIRVLVADAKGNPIEGAKISMRALGPYEAQPPTTNAQGMGQTYWIGHPDQIITIEADGFAASDVSLAGEYRPELSVVLSPGLVVVLQFLGPDDKPINATLGVDLVNVATGQRAGNVCRDGNPTRVEHLAPGTYKIEMTRLNPVNMDCGPPTPHDELLQLEGSGVTSRTVKLKRLPEFERETSE